MQELTPRTVREASLRQVAYASARAVRSEAALVRGPSRDGGWRSPMIEAASRPPTRSAAQATIITVTYQSATRSNA